MQMPTHGYCAPRIDTVKAIADYFGVTVDALLKSSDGQ